MHSDMHTHLERDDNHENLLLLVRQDVLDKGPAGANQSQGDEQEGTLQPTEHASTRQGRDHQGIITQNQTSNPNIPTCGFVVWGTP